MELKNEFMSRPHRRFNPLLNSWILVSPQRLQRPWQGQKEDIIPKDIQVDINNPLCPNAIRGNGEKNPDYKSIFMFQNDFPALLNTIIEKPTTNNQSDDLFQIEPANGNCFVMCYDPRSTVTLATMNINEVVIVIEKWISIIQDIGSKFEWVQIFENRGEMMGCSNMHPHCQIWACNYLPHVPSIKDSCQRDYFKKHNSPLLYDYLKREMEQQIRIVISNKSWVCLVPFWADWPFETMLLPVRKGVLRLTDLQKDEISDLAVIMQQLLKKYNKHFSTQCPYSMGWHGAPTGSYLTQDQSHWTLHASYMPPLLRSATIRKFFVGFELLAESQRDLTPEKAAELLRNVD